MKKFLSLIAIIGFLGACDKEGTKLPDGITNIEAVFTNASVGENSVSYTLALDLDAKTGTFTYNVPASNFEESVAYEVDITLTDEDIGSLDAEIQNVRYKDCLSKAILVGAANKQVAFSYEEEDQIIVYELDTNNNCMVGADEYYFSSSYTNLYNLFETIIDAQNEVGTLPEGWKDVI